MDFRRIALLLLLFFTFYVHGKPTKTPAVTFPGSGRTTPGPDSAGANNIMYRVVLPLGIFLLVAGAIVIFCCYKYKAWRRREQKQATDLAMVRVEKPVVQKPVVKIKKNIIRPQMDNIKKEMPIIKKLKAAKKEEEKIMKRTSKTEEEKIMEVTFKTEEEKIMKVTSKTEEEITKRTSKTEKITMRTSRLNRFRKWIKKNTCCSCRSMD